MTRRFGSLWRGSRGAGASTPVRKGLYLVSTLAVVLFGLGTQVVGASAATATNGAYTGLTPCRIESGTVTAGGSLSVTVAGKTFCGESVPSTAQAVVVNATVTQGTAAGYLTLYPTGGSATVSNLNFAGGETIANLVTVGVGSGGSITAYDGQPSGSVKVDLDLEGYYAPASSTAGYYVPLTPSRVANRTSVGAGQTVNVQITGAGGVPSTGVSAVVFNLTATAGTAGSYLTAFPAGATRPTASNLNFGAGETIPNRVIVPVGTGGQVSLYNAVGTAQVVVDVDGWYTDASASATQVASYSLFTPLTTPIRALDTRTNGKTLSAGGTVALPLAGVDGIPSTAVAVAENVTETGATAGSYFTVYPSSATRPTASDLNFGPGETIPNYTQATLGSSGSETIYNSLGSANAVVDLFGYFAPSSGYLVTVTPATSTVQVNGTDAIAVTVTKDGTGLADGVYATVSGTGCGTITSTNPTTTSAAGVASFTYTAGATAGACTITVMEASSGMTGSATVTQTATNTVTFSGTPYVVTVASNTGDTVTVSASVSGVNPDNDTVTFATSATPSGACGTLSPTSGSTGASNVAVTATYLASTTAGFCTVTATEANTGQTASTVIDQKLATAPAGLAITATASPTSIQGNGTATSTITANVVDTASPSGLSGDAVMATLAPASASECGSVSSGIVVTDSSGNATFTYTAGQGAASCTVDVTEAQANAGNSATVAQTATNSVAVSASPTSLAASGTATSTITVTVTTSTGLPDSGDSVSVVVSPFPGAECGTIATSPTSTSSSGVATFAYTPGTGQGYCTLTATEANTLATGTVQIDQTAPAAAPTPTSVTVSATTTTLQANGATTSVSVVVNASDGSTISGDSINLSLSGAGCDLSGTHPASLSVTSGVSPLSVTYTSNDDAVTGTCTITANDFSNGLSGSTTITQTVNNVITAEFSDGYVGTTATLGNTDTLDVSVKTVAGTNVSGDAISITMSAYPSGACGLFSPASGTTDSSGNFVTTYLGSTVAGWCTVTVKEAATGQSVVASGIDGSATPEAQTSTTDNYAWSSGGPYTLNAATQTATLTATVTDQATGTPAASAPIWWELNGPDCGTVSNGGFSTTNSSGVATITYTTAAAAGDCSVNAWIALHPSAGGLNITQANTVTLSGPSTVATGGTATLNVSVTDPAGHAISGDTVTFAVTATTGTAAAGTFSSAGSVTTNASGTASLTYTGGTGSGFVTITATEGDNGNTGTIVINQG